MKRNRAGEYVVTSGAGEKVEAFVPDPLPPRPPVNVDDSLRDRLDQAHLEIGRLDGISSLLPDIGLFLYMYIRKEAVLSSQIEGTQSSLSDLLLFEMEGVPGVPMDDAREVSNYVAAMEHGLKRLREGFPLCNRLLCEIHGKLMGTGRGSQKQPGEFRTSQNWIGGSRPGNARFVPPPPDRMVACLGAFEKFLNGEPGHAPTLIKAALAHVQFETIHPFLDGNGRVGRLLIPLLLCHEKVLGQPLLYPSLYFKQHRDTYYDLLQRVRLEGEWEAWVEFFAEAMRDTARQAVSTATRLSAIVRADRDRAQGVKRRAGSILRLLDVMARVPIVSVARASRETGIVPSSVSAALKNMAELGMVRELTGWKRNRLFCYDRYLDVLSEGTEPLD
ncbi:MAG: Fic family protein [Opitutae bacterium]|nr:Fic family protein [Opitutae bacterium]